MFYAFLIVLFLGIAIYFQSREGFTSGKTPKDTVAKIADSNSTLTDTLNVDTYRTSYEDMVTGLTKWANLSMINLLAQGKIGLDSDSSDSVKQFNDLAAFKIHLAALEDVLDHS
jgi:hypothetical protein